MSRRRKERSCVFQAERDSSRLAITSSAGTPAPGVSVPVLHDLISWLGPSTAPGAWNQYPLAGPEAPLSSCRPLPGGPTQKHISLPPTSCSQAGSQVGAATAHRRLEVTRRSSRGSNSSSCPAAPPGCTVCSNPDPSHTCRPLRQLTRPPWGSVSSYVKAGDESSLQSGLQCLANSRCSTNAPFSLELNKACSGPLSLLAATMRRRQGGDKGLHFTDGKVEGQGGTYGNRFGIQHFLTSNCSSRLHLSARAGKPLKEHVTSPLLVHRWENQPRPSKVKGAPKVTQQVPGPVLCILVRAHPSPHTSLPLAQTPPEGHTWQWAGAACWP